MEEKKVIGSNKALIITASVLVAVLAVLSAYFAFVVSSYGGAEGIARGITIDEIDVGGMTEEKAVLTVNSEKEKLLENTIELVMDDKITTATFEEFNITYNTEDVAKKAAEYGKKGNIFKRIGQCVKIHTGMADFNTEAVIEDEEISDYVAAYYQSIGCTVVENSYVIEDDKLVLRNGKAGEGIDKKLVESEIKDVLKSGKSGQVGVNLAHLEPAPWDADSVYENVCKDPTDAGYEEVDGKGYIVEAKNGYKFKKSDLEKLLKENASNTEAYTLNLEVIEPENKKINETGLFKEVISEYTSSLAGSAQSRKTNVILACQAVNGTILNPGEIFSYNETLGPVTAAAGYQPATIFTSKGHETGIGGGICQVSSTLYSAALYGDLEIVKRRNHMYIVGYVPYGQDATVYEGELDFRFRNNTNEPLKITAQVVNGNVIIRFLGKKPDPSLKVEIENIIVGRTSPTTVVKEDETLDAGTITVSEKGTIGLTVDTYKKIYKNGELISNEYLHRSVYKPINRVEIHGTKPVEEPSVENPPQEETPSSEEVPAFNPQEPEEEKAENEEEYQGI